MNQTWKRSWHPSDTAKPGANMPSVVACIPVLLSALACSGAGTGEAPSDSSVAESPPAAADHGNEASGAMASSISTDVDTLVAAVIVADQAIEPMVQGEVAERYQRLLDIVGTATSAADALERTRLDNADPTELSQQLSELSTVAGQIPAQIKRVKQALRVSGFTPDQVRAVARGLDTMKLAAQSLAVGVSDEREALGLSAPTTLSQTEMLSFSTMNGPLIPGSPWYLLDEGHVDVIDVAYEDDALGISIHDESVDPDVERDPATTIMLVKPSAVVQVPDERFAFLGPVGADVWILPESQTVAENAGILWPGIATAEIEQGVLLNDTVDVRFRSFIGPDGLSLFFSPQDPFTAPTIVMDAEDGLPDIYTVPVSTHVHANWAFEAPGVYLLEVRARGRLAAIAGNPIVNSPRAILKFVVLP
jgi:surface-anchored protein